MYKGKPVIATKRPFWRSPLFPWGWYSLLSDEIKAETIETDGHVKPGDGGAGLYKLEGYNVETTCGGVPDK